MVWFLGVQGQKLGLMILMDLFQLRIFCDFVILYYHLSENPLIGCQSMTLAIDATALSLSRVSPSLPCCGWYLTPLELQIPGGNFSLSQTEENADVCAPFCSKNTPQEWNQVTWRCHLSLGKGENKSEGGASLIPLAEFLLHLRVQWHQGCWCYCTFLSWITYGKVSALEQPGKVIQAGQRKPACVWTPHLMIDHLLLQLPKI